MMVCYFRLRFSLCVSLGSPYGRLVLYMILYTFSFCCLKLRSKLWQDRNDYMYIYLFINTDTHSNKQERKAKIGLITALKDTVNEITHSTSTKH